MQIDGLKYYNRVAIPQTSPHEMLDLHSIESGGIWKKAGGPLLECVSKVNTRRNYASQSRAAAK